MFKKFKGQEDVISQNPLKSSLIKQIKQKLVHDYKDKEAFLEGEVLTKKRTIECMKCHERIQLLVIDHAIWFFNHFDESYYPSLKFCHAYPSFLPRVEVDRGAIPHLLSGANVMAPGIVRPEGLPPKGLNVGHVVAVYASGKTHALVIGRLLMPSDQLNEDIRGHAIETLHYLGDPLWRLSIA